MKNLKFGTFGLLLLSLFLFACGGKKDDSSKKEGKVDELASTGIPEVKVVLLSEGGFRQELLSTGKLYAKKAVDLSFKVSGELSRVYVKNGDRVSKGTVLAELDAFRLKVARDQAEDRLASAKLVLQEQLISRGYAIKDSAHVPPQTMDVVNTKSGYEQARLAFLLADKDWKNAVLRAPIDGVVANLDVKEYDQVNGSAPFCSLIDINTLEARFTVLESELGMIRQGDVVKIAPYSTPGEQLSGHISEINPVVDDNGQVHLRATLTNNGKLFDGMNTQVSVFRTIPNQLVIPKTAIVLRTGREVVFTYREGKSFWNYVKTGEENATEKVVVSGLNPGDSVIVEGNFNLAHESVVSIIK